MKGIETGELNLGFSKKNIFYTVTVEYRGSINRSNKELNMNAIFLKLLYYIPEGLILCLASFTFLGIKAKNKSILIFGFSFGLSTFLLRDLVFNLLPLPLGLHTMILFLLNIIFLLVIFKLPFLAAVICDLVYFFTIILVEIVILNLFSFVGISMAHIINSGAISYLYGWLNLLVIIVIVYLLKKRKIVLLPISKLTGMSSHE